MGTGKLLPFFTVIYYILHKGRERLADPLIYNPEVGSRNEGISKSHYNWKNIFAEKNNCHKSFLTAPTVHTCVTVAPFVLLCGRNTGVCW